MFCMHWNKKCITNFKHYVRQLGQEGAGGEWGGGWGGGGGPGQVCPMHNILNNKYVY